MSGSRHLAAYDRLIDDAFRCWVASLPPGLRVVALDLPQAIGPAHQRWRSWGQVFPLAPTRALPWLVAEAFPRVHPNALAALFVAYIFNAVTALVDDRLIDGHLVFCRDLNLVRHGLKAEAERLIATVGRHRDFWRRHRHTFRAYTAAHAREPQLWSGEGARDGHRRYVRESAAKAGVARLPILAIAAVGHASASDLTRLTDVIDHYLVAMQYTDDITDWEDDFRSGRWTYFIQQHLSDTEIRRQRAITLRELRRRVATAAVTEDFLAHARRHYTACIGMSSAWAMPTLRAWVTQRRDHLRTSQRPNPAFVRELERRWLSHGS